MKTNFFLKTKFFALGSAALLCVFGNSLSLSAQTQTKPVTLKMGDPAPELKVNWVKGTPVNSFDQNKLYVVEFWATWCGPCKAAMPHLSELAKHYVDKVTFIGVNVWERGFENKPYSDAMPQVKEFVESMGDKMGYNVAMDNDERFMANQWLRAAGQNSIPASFLIKDGKIIWIGHPMRLDGILESVLAGTYDMNAYISYLEKEKAEEASAMAAYNELNNKVAKAVEQKDYKTANEIIDNTLPSLNPKLKADVYLLKFRTLMAYDPDQAITFCENWKKEDQNAVFNLINLVVYNKEVMPDKAYQMALNDCKKLKIDPRMKDDVSQISLDMTIAECYYKLKDKNNAVQAAENAIQTAEKLMSAPGGSQKIDAKSIAQMKKTLERYKM
jgi:thiol-disulfide isomerase/thioredoxin